MRQKRFALLYASLTSVAKKVYDLVPISTAWTPHDLLAEAVRKEVNMTRDRRVIEGVLSSLVDTGLVREGPRGFFQRIKVEDPKPNETKVTGGKADPVSIPTPVLTLEPKPAPLRYVPTTPTMTKTTTKPVAAAEQPTPSNDILGRLQAISHNALEFSKQLEAMATAMRTLSSSIETAALEINEQSADALRDAEELRQLQQLLKVIG